MVDEVKTQTEDYIEIKIPKQDDSNVEKKAESASASQQKSAGSASGKKKSAKNKSSSKKKVAKPIMPKKTASKKNESKTVKKEKTKKSIKKQVKQQNNALWAALLIIGLIVIAVVIYLSLQDEKNVSEVDDDRVAAIVNGEAIYLSELEDLYNKLPESTKITTSKDDVLDQLIEQKVLIQEAKKLGIQATEEEVDAYIDEMLTYFGFTEEQLEQVLAQQNIPMEDFVKSTREQVVLAKLINESVLMKISISDDKVKAYYDANTMVFTIPESVLVKHILITSDMNTTANEVFDMIDEDKENFCELVTEYSQDTGSVAACGEYLVAQDGQFVPEFEEAAFDMDLDELRLVETDFGIHIMWKVDEIEESVQAFDDVKEEIKAFLAQQQSSQEVPVYIASLRDEATIEVYALDGEVATPTATTPAPIEVEVEAEEEREVVVEKTKPARLNDFADCLADISATMYGVDWAPDVEEQKELLGDAFKKVIYVDCDVDACDGITVYPTWTFDLDGEELVLKGKQSLNSIERETACTSA